MINIINEFDELPYKLFILACLTSSNQLKIISDFDSVTLIAFNIYTLKISLIHFQPLSIA